MPSFKWNFLVCTFLLFNATVAFGINFDTPVAKAQIDVSKFKSELGKYSLSSHFQSILDEAVNKNLLIKYYPCLAVIDPGTLSGYKSRLEKILIRKVSNIDRRFSLAFNPTEVPFTDDMRAVASANLVMRNFGQGTFNRAQVLKVANFSRLNIGKLIKLPLGGFTGGSTSSTTAGSGSSGDEEEEGDVFSADNKSFRATVGEHNQLICEVFHGGRWKKIISADSYLHTPCYELNVPRASIDDDLTEETDETPPVGGGCSTTRWKYHLNDLAIRLSLAKGLIKETHRFDLLDRVSSESAVYNTFKAELLHP